MSIYSSKIVRLGEQSGLFLAEGIVVFFGDNAPEELQDVAVVHKLNPVNGEIVVGTTIELSGETLKVTAIGEVANENFKNLGHLVLKLDAAEEPALPGDVSCSYSKIPEIVLGDTINIF
tara:strand:- start:12 stop:368 length:357 start_codon:yes stop_codon:yes gene_type:complete